MKPDQSIGMPRMHDSTDTDKLNLGDTERANAIMPDEVDAAVIQVEKPTA